MSRPPKSVSALAAVDPLLPAAPVTLEWWGSECLECASAVQGTMRCDVCDSSGDTVPLYLFPEGTKGAYS